MEKLAEILDLLAEKAPAVRDAGVTAFEVEGVRVELAPARRETASAVAEEQQPEIGDPLADPDTFGGALPGFPRLHETE